jgi:glycosyltransferase involved in cell wall biosynthesis
LLLPSEIEGFGIPAVEGYLLGTPVAFAKGTALEEIVGPDSPGGFDRDVDSFLAALNDVLNMNGAAVTEKAAWLKARYNWNNCVRGTVAAYRTLL